MAAEFVPGYSGGPVPDSHRVPFSAAKAAPGKFFMNSTQYRSPCQAAQEAGGRPRPVPVMPGAGSAGTPARGELLFVHPLFELMAEGIRNGLVLLRIVNGVPLGFDIREIRK